MRQHVAHQRPPDRAVLRGRIDGDRTHSRHRIAYPEKVTADDASAALGDHAVHVLAREQIVDEAVRDVYGWEVRRKVVVRRDRVEGFVHDARNGRRIVGLTSTQQSRAHGTSGGTGETRGNSTAGPCGVAFGGRYEGAASPAGPRCRTKR